MRQASDLIDTAALEEQLDRWRGRIGSTLAQAVTFYGVVPASLRESMSHAVLAGGRRYRGSLALALGTDFALPEERLLSSAAAIEIIHAASLVVDDLPCMDDARRRRSQPATHVAYGEATAILASIALIARATELVAQDSHLAPHVRNSIVQALSQVIGAQALCGGQYDDLYPPPAVTEQALIDRYERKTSALFVAALQVPALIAGVDAKTQVRLSRAGESLGLAFQIFDDLLDLTSDPQAIGKDVGKDGAKTTLPTLLGPVKAAERAADELAAVRKALSDTVGPGHALDLVCWMASRMSGLASR